MGAIFGTPAKIQIPTQIPLSKDDERSIHPFKMLEYEYAKKDAAARWWATKQLPRDETSQEYRAMLLDKIASEKWKNKDRQIALAKNMERFLVAMKLVVGKKYPYVSNEDLNRILDYERRGWEHFRKELETRYADYKIKEVRKTHYDPDSPSRYKYSEWWEAGEDPPGKADPPGGVNGGGVKPSDDAGAPKGSWTLSKMAMLAVIIIIIAVVIFLVARALMRPGDVTRMTVAHGHHVALHDFR